jgi:hypothetical protein
LRGRPWRGRRLSRRLRLLRGRVWRRRPWRRHCLQVFPILYTMFRLKMAVTCTAV